MGTITIKDIANICGVGVTTVSRAINNHPDINKETKDKIMAVIDEYNYVPNNSARNLKRQESNTIAVLIKGINNPFFSPMITVFEQIIQEKKFSFFLQRVEEGQDEVDIAIALEKEKRLKGIIFLGGYFSHARGKLEQLSVPFVLSTISLQKDVDGMEYASVCVDDYLESYRMVDFLIKQGHEKIAIISAPAVDESVGALRLEGYKKAFEDNHLPVQEELIFYSTSMKDRYSMSTGYELMKEILSSGKEFTAVYAIADSLAIGACRAILESGKKIPEDYSVAGYDGMEFASFYNPSITTIRQPVEKIAEETVRILFDLIEGKETKRQCVFPGELLVRRIDSGDKIKTKKLRRLKNKY